MDDSQITIVTERWPPYIYLDENFSVTGELTQKIKSIMALAQLQHSITLYPWPRAYSIALKQKNVLIYPIFKTTDRLPLFHFICPLASKVVQYFIKLSSRKDIRLNTIEDAKKYRIGLIRDDHDHLLLLQKGFEDGKQIDANIDNAASLKKLLKGRIDLIIQSKGSLKRLLKKHQIAHSKVDLALQINDQDGGENCLAMSLGTDRRIVGKVREALAHINKTTTMIMVE